jgi:hypothetical protein
LLDRDRLFAYPKADPPPQLRHLYLIAWRHILTDFYRRRYEPSKAVTAHTLIIRTIERYIIVVKAKAHCIKNIALRALYRQEQPPTFKRLNKILDPLFLIDDEANLLYNPTMKFITRELKIEHTLHNLHPTS